MKPRITAAALCALAGFVAPAVAQPLISEIMFDPIAERGCEYVEIVNPSDSTIPLRDWRIVDGSGRTQATFPKAASIAPGGYVVIAADTLVFAQFPWLVDSASVIIAGKASFGLNSDGDAVVLADRKGIVVDSLWYLPAWHRPDIDDASGTALERASLSAPSTDGRNWSSSTGRNGGTPGGRNSVALPIRVAVAELAIEPETVSPDADGVDDVARISYRLPTRTARISVTVHDRHGRLLERLANAEASGPEGELVWRAFDHHGMPLPPEIYVIRIEAYDALGVGLVSARSGVVVARR